MRLKALSPVLGDDRPVSVLTDRAYATPEFLRACLELGYRVIVRLKSNRKLYRPGGVRITAVLNKYIYSRSKSLLLVVLPKLLPFSQSCLVDVLEKTCCVGYICDEFKITACLLNS